MSYILGIDPGQKGALAWLEPAANEVVCAALPMIDVVRGGRNSHDVDVIKLRALLQMKPIRRAFLEQLGPRRFQGAGQMWNLAEGYATIKTILMMLSIPYETVTPSVWKKSVDLIGEDKKGSIRCASRLMPRHSLQWGDGSDGKAEAALIAWFGAGTTTGAGIA